MANDFTFIQMELPHRKIGFNITRIGMEIDFKVLPLQFVQIYYKPTGNTGFWIKCISADRHLTS